MDGLKELDLDGSKEDLDDGVEDKTDPKELVAQLKAQLDASNAEAAKYRKLKNDAIKERDALRKVKESNEEKSWEALFKQSQEEMTRIKDSSKKQAISAAIKDTLMKQGVLQDALNDAVKLVDASMVSWDAEDGVDTFSVESAVKLLRGSSKYLFESKIPPTGDPKTPKNGSVQSDTEITRKDWDAIKDPVKKAQAAMKYKIVE